MRKIFLFLIASALAALVAGPCRADEAQKIIDQYLKAVGGAKLVSHLQTLSIDGSVAAAGDEVPGTYTFKVKQPNRIYTELRSNGKTLIESYNGKSAWHLNREGELSTFLGREAVEMEAAAQYYNARLQSVKLAWLIKARRRFAAFRRRNWNLPTPPVCNGKFSSMPKRT